MDIGESTDLQLGFLRPHYTDSEHSVWFGPRRSQLHLAIWQRNVQSFMAIPDGVFNVFISDARSYQFGQVQNSCKTIYGARLDWTQSSVLVDNSRFFHQLMHSLFYCFGLQRLRLRRLLRWKLVELRHQTSLHRHALSMPVCIAFDNYVHSIRAYLS